MRNAGRMPNLRHLRILLTVARVNSISRASEEVNMSQPAVTQAIAKMEAEYGVALFERRSTGSFPTAAGTLLVRRIARFFEIADAAVRATRQSARAFDEHARVEIEQFLTATQIRAFLAAIDRANTPRLAEEIGISETSLFRSSREVEKALRRPLFRRTAYGLEGNTAGTVFARHLRVALRELEYGNEELAEALKSGSPVIRIGVLPMSGSFVLASAINALMQEMPDVRVIVLDGAYVNLLDALRLGRIDMMFGLLRKPANIEDVTEETLFEDGFRVVGRRNHPLAHRARVTRKDLAGYNWIVPAPGTPRRVQIDRLFAEFEPAPRLCVETSSLSTIRALTVGSDLLTVMSKQEVDFEERTGLFSTIDYALRTELPPKGITVRRNWLPTEVHRRFIELMRLGTAVPTQRYPAARRPRPLLPA